MSKHAYLALESSRHCLWKRLRPPKLRPQGHRLATESKHKHTSTQQRDRFRRTCQIIQASSLLPCELIRCDPDRARLSVIMLVALLTGRDKQQHCKRPEHSNVGFSMQASKSIVDCTDLCTGDTATTCCQDNSLSAHKRGAVPLHGCRRAAGAR